MALDHLRWPLLRTRHDQSIYKLVKKCLQGRCPQFFKNYFIFNNRMHDRNNRKCNKLHLPKVRTEIAKRSFYFNGYIVYNKLH